MSRGKVALIAVAVIIVIIIGYRMVAGGAKHGRMGGAGGGAAAEAVPVTVVPAREENVPVYLTNQGTVQPINTVNVQPQVSGQLLKLDFDEGKPVKKGQVLAYIDARTIQAQLDQVLAKRAQDKTLLATAKANLGRSESPKYRQYVAQIDRITQKNTVAQYQAAVAADDASIASSRVQLDFTKVTSPIDGVAGIRQVDPGNVINTNTTIVTVTQMHPINVIFSLAGQYLDEVRTAQAKAPLKVAVLNADSEVVDATGQLKVIDNQIDPNTGAFKLKAAFLNTNNQLYPGQYANIRLQVSVDADALVVPTAAVQRGPNGEYVWLVTDQPPASTVAQQAKATPPRKHASAKDGKQGEHGKSSGLPVKYVKMQTITTGGEAGSSGLIVTKGLKAGDDVVTAGQFRLRQGTKVNALKPGDVPAPPTTAEIKQAADHPAGGRRH